MKGILLLNGEAYQGEIDAGNSYVVCCDGAYDWAKDKVKIDENCGDYDSLSYLPSPLPKKVYPRQKNYTDGELGIRLLLEKGVSSIEIYGGGGKREDHFIGNLHLLFYAFQQNIFSCLITNYAKIYLIKGKKEWNHQQGTTLSLMPFFENAMVENSQGLAYPLKNLSLEYGTCRGISNVIENEKAWVDCKQGMLLVFENKK